MKKAILKPFCLLLCVLILEGCGERQGGELISYEIGYAGVTVTDCEGASEGDLEIPAEIEGMQVTRIGDWAFSTCSGLTSITIPGSVKRVGSDAFWGCSNITSITIPDSVTSIGFTAFYGCSSLTSVTIPDSVTGIGGGAFVGCTSLTSITIPQAFHSQAEASRLGLDGLWPDGFALPDSSSN